jgi:hypothetical protein
VRIRIRDPGLGAFLTPGSGIRDPGWVESQHPDPGSGINNPDHFFKSLETIFLIFWGLKYLNSLMRIRDPGSGSGMETVRIRDPGWKKAGSGIRDKHPGSATLINPLEQDRDLDLHQVTWGSEFKSIGNLSPSSDVASLNCAEYNIYFICKPFFEQVIFTFTSTSH